MAETASLFTRFRNAWNAFTNRDPTTYWRGGSYYHSSRPDRIRYSRGNERTIITSIYNRIALDAAAIEIVHCRLDEDNRFLEVIESGLNTCLNLEANTDQTGVALIQDAISSMFDEGCVAIVPVDTSIDPDSSNSFDILSLRTGKIVGWYPQHVDVEVYNEQTMRKETVRMAKKHVAIIENPFYAVMNETNSTMQRLVRKLNLLDAVDEQTSSGKLDLIIQLPYTIKTETRRQQAESRRKDIESQLTGSKYGIAYTDGTERITQLNRPIENNLLKQIEYYTSMLYSQLNMTQSILDGTADEKTMNNYYNRTIKVLVKAIVDEMKRKFLTKTARSQKQSILFFRDVFEFGTVSELAEAADKFTRNEILSKNEVRQIIGRRPSKDPKADQLINSNISQPADKIAKNPVAPKELSNPEKKIEQPNEST